ncbi:M15 family metallopeptidase [candidate division KSB1 bacterium]|nr:M15 family metallopeptidase [candidate division KSB1 bacterium]
MKKAAVIFIARCGEMGVHIIPTCTYRSMAEQDQLYAQGRTKPGLIVTKARAGESFHQYGAALDVVPVINGKAEWNNPALWNQIGETGESCGFEWAGRWPHFKEAPHFQITAGMDFKTMSAIGADAVARRISEWLERRTIEKETVT